MKSSTTATPHYNYRRAPKSVVAEQDDRNNNQRENAENNHPKQQRRPAGVDVSSGNNKKLAAAEVIPPPPKKLERMSTEDVNASAEAFIQKFRQQLFLQRVESIENYEQMLKRGT